MVLKKGRFGTFYACSGYPDCKTTKQIGGPQRKADQPLDEQCPNCGSGLVLKTGRFGEFTACSNYPACKYVKQKTIGVKCPECSEGEIVERRSRKGKTFYGCNRYPDCKFVAWGKPIDEKAHAGRLVVNADAAPRLAKVFRRLYAMRFPIHHMSTRPANGDGTASFECRQAVPSP